MKIVVTQEIIDEAQNKRDNSSTFDSCGDCVIAKAVQNAYNNPKIYAAYSSVAAELPYGYATTPLPLYVTDYIWAFDRGDYLKPIEFELPDMSAWPTVPYHTD